MQVSANSNSIAVVVRTLRGLIPARFNLLLKWLRPFLPIAAAFAWVGDVPVELHHTRVPLQGAYTPLLLDVSPPPDPEHPSWNDPENRYDGESPLLGIRSAVLLPDLRTLPPSDLEIEINWDGSRALRLSNTIWNSGEGRLELKGEFNRESRQTRVSQRVYTHGDLVLEHLVGEFVWHPTHDHWHFEDFTLYELWTIDGNGARQEIVSSSDKLSYCVIDTDIIDREKLAAAPRRHYSGCGQAMQGLSAGWGDTYKANLDGQSLDLSAVKDGFYMLESTTNPNMSVLETDYTNNAAFVYVEKRGHRVDIVPAEELSEVLCRVNGRC